MPTLFHLNGAPGIGKSTLAQMYVDQHSGTLHLDADLVTRMIGGWQEDFWKTLHESRAIAVAMAATHLKAGKDVVLPQLVTSHDEIDDYLRAANENDAQYLQIALTAPKDTALKRFANRASDAGDDWNRHITGIIEKSGGPQLLLRIHDQLDDYLRKNPPVAAVDTDGSDPSQVYAELKTTLEALREPVRAENCIHAGQADGGSRG
ncbi:AAA family ATPase [Lentzea sp. HUAS TT2]|uniref:AAA family ATPase n=1 Tax=Lentzea sp. HUAS TT2 TaxID=3447454 RepID=UPI003F6E80AD